MLVFGPESRGLPDDVLATAPGRQVRIPMRPETRSLNLSTAVGVALYEALRQVRRG
jgi:tRNA (cytidine/uridine-2'-O-)-methyltransferase